MADGNGLQKGRQRTAANNLEYRWSKAMDFGDKKRMRLYQRYERFLEKGFDYKKATERMWARYNRTKDTRRAVFRVILDKLSEGVSFSEAISPYIPPAERLLIASGEQTGKPERSFQDATYIAEAIKRMRGTIVGASIYPAILLTMLAGMLAGVAFMFVPTMLQMAPLETWPPVSKAVYHLAEFVTGYGVYLLAGAILSGIIIFNRMPHWTGTARSWLDQWVPPWTIYREYQGATFLLSLAALVAAGRPVDTAIKQINAISTRWLKSHLMRIGQALNEGLPPGRAMDTGLLHRETVGDIEDYSSAGAFDSAIASMGKESIEDAISRIKAASSVFTGLCLFLVAGTLVLIYMAMIFLVMDVAQKAQVGR